MKTKRLLSLLMASALSLSLFAACGDTTTPDPEPAPDPVTDGQDAVEPEADDSLQYIVDNGKLILGLDDSFPPMGFRDENGDIVGFDIDLARAVCEKLGVELELQPISWDAKEMELNAKNIDCIWNGMSVTEQRQNDMSLSLNYMPNHMALVVKPDSGISTIADMDGKSLALQTGSSAEEALDSEEGEELRGLISGVNGFDDNLTALLDLETNASDAVLMDEVVANYLITANGKDYIVLGDFLYAEDYAIGFRKEDAALTEAVNDALRALKAEGVVTEIAEKWFGEDLTTFS